MLANARWELMWTSVGLKAVMAATGVVLSGWVLLHMIGNLLVFGGPALINGYAEALQSGPILWVQRAAWVLALALHVGAAIVLTTRSAGARSERYHHRLRARERTVSSRSMRWGGLALALFLAYHVAHMYGGLHPHYVEGDVYSNVVRGLSDPVVGTLYVLATIVFGLHLHHGTASLFRSLGHAGLFERGIRRLTLAFTTVVTIGFLSPCVAALTGLLRA